MKKFILITLGLITIFSSTLTSCASSSSTTAQNNNRGVRHYHHGPRYPGHSYIYDRDVIIVDESDPDYGVDVPEAVPMQEE